jgi:hypothetical protein
MTSSSTASTLQASPAAALPGNWKLAPGRAVTLRPATNGILRIARGQVWATLDGPHGGRPDDSGDHVLAVGRSLWVRAGQRVVLEAWDPQGGAWFGWDPVLAPAPSPLARRRPDFAGVLQPLADLRQALRLAGSAFARLLVGVGRLAVPATHNGRHGHVLPVR